MKESMRSIIKGKKAIDEGDAKHLLELFQIPTTNFQVVKKEEDLEPVNLTFPLALKVCSPKIQHKTDIGGVRLNIRNNRELRNVFREFKNKFPGENLLVEEMARPGVEIILGLLQDDTFGLTIMLGIGGILTELYRDITFRIVPIERDDAQKMMTDLRGRQLLEGFRGIRTDREAIINLLLSVSSLGEELKDYIDQLDLNPVFVYEKGLCVVDAKLILKHLNEGNAY